MMYSVRMRAAKDGAHEVGGKHISGAERLLPEEGVEDAVRMMLARARGHSRGKADFINIKIEAVARRAVEKVPLLALMNLAATAVKESQDIAAKLLLRQGIAPQAIEQAFSTLLGLKESMRGAVLLNAATGKRVDGYGMRGVRVSRMDVEDEEAFALFLSRWPFAGAHLREAAILAAKVAACPEIVGELCWSDDPGYVTGYVSTGKTYYRIAPLKEQGDERGGRVFFVKPEANIEKVIHYLEKQPVLVAEIGEMDSEQRRKEVAFPS